MHIKKFAEIIRMENLWMPGGDLYSHKDISDIDIQTDSERGRSLSRVENEIINIEDLDRGDSSISDVNIMQRSESSSSDEIIDIIELDISKNYIREESLCLDTQSEYKDVCYSCKDCEYETTSKGNLKEHTKYVHGGVKYFCNQCDYQSMDRETLNEHEKSIHKGTKYGCDQCDFHFTDKNNLAIHNKSVHEGENNSSKQKENVYESNINGFAQADKNMKGKKLSESLKKGNSSSPERDNQDENEQIFNINPSQNCDYSSENSNISNDVVEIINHDTLRSTTEGVVDLIRSDGKHLYKCGDCEKSFKNIQGLEVHITSIHKGIWYSCKNCNYKASKKGILKAHQESKHEGVKYSCDQCDHKAAQKSGLLIHKQSVHQGVTYSCNLCDYQATQQCHLKTHKALHTRKPLLYHPNPRVWGKS